MNYYGSIPLFDNEHVYVTCSGKGISGLFFSFDELMLQTKGTATLLENHEYIKEATKQLHEYVVQTRQNFDLPLEITGTAFQQKVWKELKTIPYGEVISYKQLASMIGQPKAVRAVGQANRRNRLPIFLPCHRVVGASKDLTGYAGAQVHLKERLLTLEGIQVANGKVVLA
ncbi:methylated-DNA--[protein]-cysteine S-methyltransferase [Priestia flexa]|uniref:Methylated-DNA--[protein]-cysteine S-methyltransferase n=1 Tax=Priestia flexa TaxID=86664 RepID=A0ABU4J1P9_9BACI|nr:methylated-DNA--[protein]-cysteine S-methyltransferase [Priestia flexa]MDW8514967.1 methylated-DNA--[protein]-cysteine S-methyltransferase [Priestia flexa]